MILVTLWRIHATDVGWDGVEGQEAEADQPDHGLPLVSDGVLPGQPLRVLGRVRVFGGVTTTCNDKIDNHWSLQENVNSQCFKIFFKYC